MLDFDSNVPCFRRLLLTLAIALWATASPADRLVRLDQGELAVAELPRGPFVPTTSIGAFPRDLTFAPDGRLFAFENIAPPITAPFLSVLYVITDEGEIGTFQSILLEVGEVPWSLAFGPDGRLFVLTVSTPFSPPQQILQLLELDPSSAEILGRRTLNEDVHHIAHSSRGLWLLGTNRLLHYDVDRQVVDADLGTPSIGVVVSADSDSTGALWILSEPGFVDPPLFDLYRFDPVTGSLEPAPFLHNGLPSRLAIDRFCGRSETAHCLQGGRFRAEVQWRDFQGREGDGRITPGSSTDSGLFWFFDPANWEMLIKIIDGCDENGHFWLFSAGTTDVEYTLEVTDLLTGETATAFNPLGRASPAVTNTSAFSGCP